MRKFFYWLWLALSILMIPAGIYAVCNPGATLVSLAALIGIVMLLEGVSAICVFAYEHKFMLGSGWVLMDGIVTTVLAVILLWNNVFTASALPYAFGMWVVFSGIQKIVYSLDMKLVRVRGWGWVLATGILLSVAGVLSLADPVTGAVAISVLVGWALIFYGVSSIVLWSRVNELRRVAKQAKRNMDGFIEIN